MWLFHLLVGSVVFHWLDKTVFPVMVWLCIANLPDEGLGFVSW